VIKIQEHENQASAHIYVSKVLHFHQSAGQLDDSAKVCTKDQKWLMNKGRCGTCPNVLFSVKCVHTMEPK
jgi:hypothetical protein